MCASTPQEPTHLLSDIMALQEHGQLRKLTPMAAEAISLLLLGYRVMT